MAAVDAPCSMRMAAMLRQKIASGTPYMATAGFEAHDVFHRAVTSETSALLQSEIARLQIDAVFVADRVEVLREPLVAAIAADLEKMGEEFPGTVHLA